MKNTSPFEVIAAPTTLYVAAVGTAFPEVDENPGAGWTKIGSNGDRNYDDGAGVALALEQTIAYWKSLGATGKQKAFRTDEGVKIGLELVDLSLEQFKVLMNGNTVTTTAAGAGTPGTKKVGLSRGRSVTRYALLMRIDASPYGEEFVAQFEIPIAVEAGNPKPVAGKKGEPMKLAVEFEALEDPAAATEDERFGRIVAQTAEAA